MSTQRTLLLAFIVLGVLVAMVLGQLIASLGGIGPLGFLNDTVLDIENFWANAIGFAIALGTGLYCWKSERIHAAGIQVVEELQRVTWPTWAETKAATVAVIVATFIVAVMLGVFDYGWAWATQQIYNPVQ